MAGIREESKFRCYYDDGTIITADFCPLVNDGGSPLLKSELTIIEDVEGRYTNALPWFLLILGLLLLTSKKGN